jgi:chromosome segregation ATPase
MKGKTKEELISIIDELENEIMNMSSEMREMEDEISALEEKIEDYQYLLTEEQDDAFYFKSRVEDLEAELEEIEDFNDEPLEKVIDYLNDNLLQLSKGSRVIELQNKLNGNTKEYLMMIIGEENDCSN